MERSTSLPGTAVLIVEDDALVRAETVDLVEEAGFTAFEARSAEQALGLLQRHPDIGILFTDVEMPGSMDGLMLAKAVRELWPSVTIMVTSGRVTLAAHEMPEGSLFFAKPYLPDALLEAFDAVASRLRS